MTFHKNPISLSALLVVAAVLLAVGPLASAPAQTEKLKMVLESIDADGDGDLDQREMSPRIEKYLQSKGVDTSRSPSIRKILKRVEEKNGTGASQAGAAKGELKVPGFGVDQADKQSQGGLLSFSNKPQRNVDPKVTGRAKIRAQETLERYDRNRDKILSDDELRRARWGNPPAQESDTNGDGRLSLSELVVRYEDRYVAEQKENERKSKERSDEKRNGEGRQPIVSSSKATLQKITVATTAKSSSAKVSDNSKYEKYAAGLMARYDKDKNGWLDKDEVAKMRRPPKGDPNNDGRITKAELIALNSPKGTVVSSRSKTTRTSSSRGSSVGRDSSKGKSVFGGKDKNEDQQIQMNEFAERWTEKTVNEFNKLDTNGDAVISVDEWLKK